MNQMPVQGAQVVSRIAALLRIVGRKPEGSPLVELVRESGLTRPTVHRLLTSLAAEGLLDHDARTGNWVLGPEVIVMGRVVWVLGGPAAGVGGISPVPAGGCCPAEPAPACRENR